MEKREPRRTSATTNPPKLVREKRRKGRCLASSPARLGAIAAGALSPELGSRCPCRQRERNNETPSVSVTLVRCEREGAAVSSIAAVRKWFRPPQMPLPERKLRLCVSSRREWLCGFRDHCQSSGLSFCHLRPCCRRRKTLPERVLIVVSVLFKFREYYSHCMLVSVVVIIICRRCRLKWLPGYHRTGPETATVSVQPSFLIFGYGRRSHEEFI
ncbi:uncharacterized protein [Arachis hypogaea]|uniref:uncharacterized protein isoform X2 n=1 Tax=Arachis hypogaea TaxID=3818 RepID=UPI000786E7B8|nr:uncharacterized protein LOC112800865 isoform X2 [Arachis hypogaea]